MGYRWPADTAFTRRVLTIEDENCSVCGRRLHVCDHRFHRIFTLAGPVELLCKLAHCPAAECPAHARTLSPLAEAQLTLPRWVIGWDVFCWLGHRRFARHWSVPQLRAEAREKFSRIRPANIGQASRVSGITPADLAVLLFYLG